MGKNPLHYYSMETDYKLLVLFALVELFSSNTDVDAVMS